MCSDGFMTYSVRQQQYKPWVQPLLLPYLIVFCIAAVTSVATIGLKCRLVIGKLCKRGAEMTDWHADVAHDSKRRQEWIAKLAAEEQVYNTMENESIARGTALLDMFSAQLSSAAKSQGRFKHDPHTNRLIGYAEGLVRGASPQQIVAYLMDIESRFVQGHQNRDETVRFEVLSTINDHHKVVYTEVKTAPFTNRTFLTSFVCLKISLEPPTWVWVALPIPAHPRIRPEDERHAVRGEVMRCCKLTATSATETKMEYASYIDLRGNFPGWLINNVVLPAQVWRYRPDNLQQVCNTDTHTHTRARAPYARTHTHIQTNTTH